jgi:hypothetical protein
VAITKVRLSGGTNGRQIKVAATATAGTLIHTADATALDEIYLWAFNSSTAALKLTIELGGVTSPDDLIEQTIAAEDGYALVVPGLPLTGGVVVRAFCASANLVMLNGFVNRIT